MNTTDRKHAASHKGQTQQGLENSPEHIAPSAGLEHIVAMVMADTLNRAADFAKLCVEKRCFPDFLFVLISVVGDMPKTFPGTFQDFHFEIMKSQHF